jgi:hypothetical protein
MEELERAITTTETLRAALEAEVGRARHERVLIRTFDVQGLLERATARGELNALVAALERDLAGHLAGAGRALGLEEVTLEALAARAPEPAARLAASLAEVRSCAAALAELDDLNRSLTQKALACVRGYLNAVMPVASAYDRRGAGTTAAEGTTYSGRA